MKILPLLIETNALLPHRLADLSNRYGARLIHISTDCVFSGVKGDATRGESDVVQADATDPYGRNKAARREPCLECDHTADVHHRP